MRLSSASLFMTGLAFFGLSTSSTAVELRPGTPEVELRERPSRVVPPQLRQQLFGDWRTLASSRQRQMALSDNRDLDPPRFQLKSAAELNDRGEESRKKGDFEAAIRDYTEAIKLDSFFEWPYNNRGLAWASKGQYDKAMQDYAAALRIDPKYPYPYNNRGLIWMAKGDIENAIKDYTEAIRLDRKYALAFNNRGLAWEAKSDLDNAFRDYSEAIRLDPNLTYPLNNRGRIWEVKGEYGKAMTDYAEAIQLDSKYSAPYNSIAWLRATCPDAQFRGGKEAIVFATKACELTEWKSFNELDTLAAAYAEAGEFTNAVIWQTTAVEKAPEKEKQVATQRLELFRANQPFHRPPTK